MSEEIQSQWTGQQLQYIHFLAAAQIDEEGVKWTKEDFAKKILKISPSVLYEWQKLPGFFKAVADLAPDKLIDRWMPKMVEAQIVKAVKQKDTTAFMALARQAGRLKPDRQEVEHKGAVAFTNEVPINADNA